MESSDRRREPRIRSRGAVLVTMKGCEPIQANIVDTSGSGLLLEVSREISVGTEIEIEVSGHESKGTVRHCRNGKEVYYVGVRLTVA